MKRRNILLLALLALTMAAPTALRAQDVSIGDGTSYSSAGSNDSSLGSPIANSYYYYGTAQFLYTYSEMGSAKKLGSIKFYHNDQSFIGTLKIYLVHTDKTSLSTSEYFTSGTLVYTGTNITIGGSSAGWQEFVFNSNAPFEYNGTDNLAVIVCRSKNSGSGSPSYNSSLGWRYTTYSSNYYISNNGNDNTTSYGEITGTNYSVTSTNRPNVIFTVPEVIADGVPMSWDAFCSNVNSGTTYSGKTVTLERDITVTTMCGTASDQFPSASDKYFSGTFEGNGHTLTVNYTETGSGYHYTAPFRFINGATIQNLTVAGNITTSASGAAGFVGYGLGEDYITNCVSNVTITSTVSAGTHGGFWSNINGGCKAHFTGCAFTGTFSGSSTSDWGGFAGWTEEGYYGTKSYSYFTDCIFKPTSVSVYNSGNKTFSRSYYSSGSSSSTVNVTNSYYTQALGTTQGKQAYTLTLAASPVGYGTAALTNSPTTTYNVSTIAAYSPGLAYNAVFYAGSGEGISVTATPNSGYIFSQWSNDINSTTSTSNPYTYTMTAANTRLTANFIPPYNITLTQPTGGTISVSVAGGPSTTSSTTATTGQTVTLTATPDSGYEFGSWSVTGVTGTASGNTYTFTMPSGNVTVSATFALIPTNNISKRVYPYLDGTDYKYWKGTSSSNGSYINAGSTYAPHAAGSVSLSSTSAMAGSTVTITTTPKSSPSPGYKVLTVYTKPTCAITTVSANSTYTFTMPSEAVTVYVVFAPNTSATTVTSSTPWTDGFDNMTWGNADPRSFTAYSNSSTLTAINDNGWALPLTVGDDGTGNNYTRYFSPRFWSSSTGGSQRRLSFKCREYSEVMACLPEFSNNLNELMISFDYFMENNTGTLQVGYYNCVDGSFTSVQSWSLSTGGSYDSPAGSKMVDFSTVATTLPGSQYRIAFYMDRHATNSQSSANLFHINVKKIPHEIANIDDWNAFCTAVNAGHDYSGEEVTLTADVGTAENPITTFCGTQSVSSDNTYTAFSGTFLGGGHTLTFNLTDCQKYTAPFITVENATIQNLRTAGSLTGSTSSDKQGKVHAGLVGVSRGTTNITGCSSTMAISSSYNDGDDVALSGIVASIRGGTLTVEGCAFKGSLTAPTPGNGNTNHNGGIVGYWYTGDHVYVRNTIFAPSALNVTTGDTEYSYTIARLTHSAVVTIENCYYTMVLGNAQGKEAHTFTLAADANGTVSHNLTAGATYTGSGITVYSPNGIGYDLDGDGTGDIVLGSDNTVTVTATGNTGYQLDQWSDGSTTSTDNPYTYTMTANNTTLTATFKLTDYAITYSPTEGSPYHGCYVSGVATAQLGQTVTVEVTEGTGYGLVGLKYNDGEDHTIVISGATYTFTMPASAVTVTATFGMLPVAVPFSDDFESGDEWVVEGSAINFWCIGTNKYHEGTHGLYITNNSSTQAYGYTIGTAAVSFAYKTIHLEEGTYIFSYDWYCYGEGSSTRYDYLRVLLAPSSVTLTDASSSFISSYTGIPSGWTAALDGSACLNQSSDWATKTVKTTIAASGDYKLVFVWRNDGSQGSNPAAIDNVEVFKVPSTIANITDWDHFAKAVNAGHSYSGETVTMTANVGTTDNPVTTMAGISGSNSFQGTFDGGCNTLTVNISTANEFAAPFHYVTGATIQDLKVTGTVLPTNGTSSRHAGGLVGSIVSTGVAINNCFVNVNVGNSSNKTDYCGGLIGHGHDGNISIIGSAYIGTLTVSGTNQVGGLVGWSDTPTRLTITNCLSECTYTNSDVGSFHPVGCAQYGNNIAAANISISNCYYTYTISSSGSKLADDDNKSIVKNAGNQGTPAYTVTAGASTTVALDGESCDGVGITTPDDPDDPGIGVGSTIYGGSGETLSLLLGTSTPVDYFTYSASTGILSGTATEGSDDPYTLQMTANNSVITANILKNHIASTSSDTQMTWAEFASVVSGGETYSGKTVYLDVDVNGGNNPVGTSTYPFQGTFDGGCNTLTVDISNNNQGAAPFQYIKGATIQNLHVTGSVSSSAHHTGGLVGFTDNEGPNYADAPLSRNVYIRNCHVSTSVSTSGGNYNGGIIGHAKSVHNHVIGCVYDGTITATGYTGGIIGWSDRSTVTITDTYFNGTYSGSGGFNPIGCKTETQNQKNVTVDLTISNCYYNTNANNSLPNNHCILATNASETGGTWTLRDLGKHGYALFSEVSPAAGGTVSAGSSTDTYGCSGITAYSTGLGYDTNGDDEEDALILGNGEGATLTATANTGYTFMNWTDGSTPYINNPYAVTMGTANRSVTGNFVNQKTSTDWTYSIDQLIDVPDSGFTMDGDGNVTISNAEGLAWLISKVNGLNDEAPHPFTDTTIVLTADVNMSAHTWVPIGTTEHTFAGTFNGNGHTISGITRSDAFPNQGLFGYVSGGTIHDVVVNTNLTGDSNYSGGVAGYLATSGTVYNTGSTGTVTANTNTIAVGGTVGYNAGLVHSSFAVGTVTGQSGDYVGGLVGDNHAGRLFNGYSDATNISGGNNGGLVGNNSGTVANCYSAGVTTGKAFAHTNSTTIEYCYTNAADGGYSGGTAPTGHGTYGAVASGIKDKDYMYRDNYITLASGSSTTYVPQSGATTTYSYYTDYHTIKWNGLVSALNQWVTANKSDISTLSSWYRPLTTAINNDLPVLGFGGETTLGASGNAKALKYGALDSLLTAYSAATASVFLYGSEGAVTGTPGTNTNVYLHEDAVLVQSSHSSDNFGATAGITFDNSCGAATDYLGNVLQYDWHLMSTPLKNANIGITYKAGDAVLGANDTDIDNMTGGFFPDGLPTELHQTIKWDLYAYDNTNHLWINFKRNKDNHYDMDGNNVTYAGDDQSGSTTTTFTCGKGYMAAISQPTYMCSTGTLNNTSFTLTLNDSEGSGGTTDSRAHLIGNPFHAYLDLDSIASATSNALNDFRIYDADLGVFSAYSRGASRNTRAPSKYIHPHQGFFVIAPSGGISLTLNPATMAGTTKQDGSYFRDDEHIDYPLVNLFAENAIGQRDMTVIELHRPELGGSPKLDQLRNADFEIAARLGGTSYCLLFTPEGTERVPVTFRAETDGIYKLTWDTQNGEFYSLLLIDNKTGVIYDMLTHDSYTFEARADDYASRFYITYECSGTGIDENDDSGASMGAATFAYINNGNIVIDVETSHGASLQIVDMLGRVLYSKTLAGTDGTYTVSTRGLAKGVYILRLSSNQGVKTQKIVLQ